MLKIRRSHDRLIFNIGIPIPGKDRLYIETAPRSSATMVLLMQDKWVLVFHREIFQLCAPFDTLRPRQNGRHFADDNFKCISANENVWMPILISLKFVPKGPINNIPALAQIMPWRRPGDKPLSEPMMVSLTRHICVTRPQWVKCWYVAGNANAVLFVSKINSVDDGWNDNAPQQWPPPASCVSNSSVLLGWRTGFTIDTNLSPTAAAHPVTTKTN